ncbi:hypothetical protein [Jiangella endophytica]|nr:hypothetical protein [Jiangella endophytica]
MTADALPAVVQAAVVPTAPPTVVLAPVGALGAVVLALPQW